MVMHLVSLLLAAAFTASVSAQFVAGTNGINGDAPSVLCNKTFADANATGIFTFNPGVVQGDQEGQPDNDSNFALDAAWGVTISNNIGASNATAELAAWYGTNGANYSDNAGLWYDVCVVTMNVLTTNTYYRAVDDPGDCTTALDVECADALKEQAAAHAMGLVDNPTPNPGSNLTDGSLPHVCYEIGNLITANFPEQCNKFFNGSAQAYGSAMTSSNDSWLYDGCSIVNEETDATFYYATGTSAFTSQYTMEQQEIIYTGFTYTTIPVLSIFMPIADIDRGTSISSAQASLSCPHVNHINDGSLQPSPAPEPEPVGGSGLGGGAIAGIVVGAVAGVAIIGAALWFFWLRKRRAGKRANNSGEGVHPPPPYSAEGKMTEVSADPEQQVLMTELSGQDGLVRPELPTQKSGPTVELPGDASHYDGLGGPPAELPAGTK